MKSEKAISSAVVRRLPKYYRYIGTIMDKGIVRISSQNLSDITGFTASQIRQDLNHFGGFGQQGYGYNVELLYRQLAQIIGLDKTYRMVIVGAGNMGHALAGYVRNRSEGVSIMQMFDVDPKKIGLKIAGISVSDMRNLPSYLQNNEVDIVTIATPKEVAQEVADGVVHCGVRGIWNFAPLDLKVPEGIVVESVHLDESLHTLIYYLGNLKDYPGR